MKKTVIIGCGAHASEIVEYISHINKNLPKPKYEIIGYLDETENIINIIDIPKIF